MEKLQILGDAAKYDASCASSGSGRAGKPGQLGNAFSSGLCHTWGADGRCICLLKVLQTNVCVYDCQYCHNRTTHDIPRAAFSSQELADLTIAFYRRNYIEGLFLSSGVSGTPDATMERMIDTMRILREKHRFGGYIHVKTIPGANLELVHEAGLLADRISVNVELPSSQSLQLLAPDKKPEMIFAPMKGIARAQRLALEDRHHAGAMFAPAGQSTQMIVGASQDTDRTILKLSEAMYDRFAMKRVYFSAYIPVGTHPMLPPPGTQVPLQREHRLYQADWLMRFYEFSVDEIVDDTTPHLEMDLDPKCAWALRHPEYFPVEANTAELARLIRVPGLGLVSAKKIIEARKFGPLRPEGLKSLGVVMKRAAYFLTAGGKYFTLYRHDHPFLRQMLLDGADTHQMSFLEPEPSLPAVTGLPSLLETIASVTN
jgi:putative DNA modification/repair radical SAM protein